MSKNQPITIHLKDTIEEIENAVSYTTSQITQIGYALFKGIDMAPKTASKSEDPCIEDRLSFILCDLRNITTACEQIVERL